MTWETIYFDEVTLDVKKAKEWYREQQPGLEKKFATAIKGVIERVRSAPFHYEIKYRNVRMAMAEVFPYSVHFYLDEEKNKLSSLPLYIKNEVLNLQNHELNNHYTSICYTETVV